ncbi:hypothetical protein [Globicatella sp. PHS-GS-PNBC-21-1553]|uniref:hypothetical protein n=1 Tax=Globicatella sp. PHS-GS-PNBC-21-1553 TaxID=2885764 RepID=UPI00298F2BC7|nr:hypothetical protein [Globicatella sp. PHS-GS-PNBC-21-1553]WPC07831.1 hypothetical protein LB888_07050 [Globicatella sp. PHS-GS-PNBC-21-1553]
MRAKSSIIPIFSVLGMMIGLVISRLKNISPANTISYGFLVGMLIGTVIYYKKRFD